MPVRSVIVSMEPEADLPKLAHTADVIIDAKVTGARPFLSSDEQWVLTEFTLEPLEILLAKTFPSRSPSPGSTYKFTLLGGELTLEGVPVSFVDTSLPLPTIGQELVLFSSRSTELQSWIPAAGSYAMFRVKEDGTLASSRSNASGNGASKASFIAVVKAELGRNK